MAALRPRSGVIRVIGDTANGTLLCQAHEVASDDRANRNGLILGGTAGALVGLLASVVLEALVDMPSWMGTNIAGFVVLGGALGRRYAIACGQRRSAPM